MSSTDPFQNLYQRPGFLLRRAHRISVAIFEKTCAELNLTPAQYGVLYTLHHAAGIDQSSLSRALGLDRVTILRVAKGLEGRGLITRRTGTPGRRLALALTAAGEALLAQAQPLATHAVERLEAPLDAADRATLTRLLNQLCDSLEADARAEMVAPTPPTPAPHDTAT